MGGAHSKSEINTNVKNQTINQSVLNEVNKMITDISVNNTQISSNTCSDTTDTSQILEFKDLVAKGSITIKTGQEMDAQMNFNCIQKTSFETQLTNDLTNKIMNEVQDILTADNQTLIKGNADASAKEGWGTLPWADASAKSKVSTEVSNIVANQSDDNVTNVVRNSIAYTVAQHQFSDCLSKAIASQIQKFKDLKAGADITIDAIQKESIRTIAKCIQDSDFSSSMTNQIATGLGLTINNDTKVDNGTKEYLKTHVKTEDKGLFGALFGPLNNLIKQFGTTGAVVVAGSSLLSSVCFCLIIIAVIGFLFIGEE